LSETELIKRLEVTGMASVAAARALETGLKAGLEKTQWFFLVFFWFFWVFWIFLGFFGVFQVVFL
jgi:hypothetical protein